MFRLPKLLTTAFVALSFAAATIAPATVFAAANPNSNDKNANGVAHSAKNTVAEPETNSEITADEQATAHMASPTKKSSAVTSMASDSGQEKIRICHRTASYSNPYVSITVARAAVDGITGNSGNQADHYGEHKGPIFNSSLPKHTEWGDIIPALNGGHNGQNWTDAGRAIYNNDCRPPKSAPVLLASTTTSNPAADPTAPTAPQLANTGLSIWAASLASIMIIGISALLGIVTRRKLITV